MKHLPRAHAILGHSEKMNDYFLQAKSAGEKIEGKEDRDLFLSDLHARP